MNGDRADYRSTVTLGDSVPQQVKPERGSPFDNHKAFRAWLGGLPLANVAAVSNELVGGLQELNRSKVSAKFRLKVLDELLGPIKTEGALLDKEYRDSTFPLKEHVDRLGRVAVQFYRELAIGYRIATDEIAGLTSNVSWINRGRAAHAINAALCCHEQYLLRMALLYQEIPPGVWNEIHSLYAFAEQNTLQEKNSRELFAETKSSIEQLYKRVCLLGVSDLRRLGQRAVRQIVDAVPAWADRVNMVLGVPRPGLFEVDHRGDDPPQLIEDAAATQPGKMLDLSGLREWLRPMGEGDRGGAEIAFRTHRGATVTVDRITLQQIMTAWGSRVERSFKRLPADHEIKMIVGLNGIHYMVSGEIGLNQFIEDLDDMSFFASASSNQNWIAAADDRYRPVEYKAAVINQSVGGYRLRLSDMVGLNLRVGEIVSVCAASIANRDTTWLLGLVRWMHAISADEMEVGVVVIGHAVRAAAVLLESDADERAMPPFRGLIMDGFSPGAENAEHLLIPGFVCEVDARIRLAYRQSGAGGADSEPVVIRAARLASLEDRTTEISRFSFVDLADSDGGSGAADDAVAGAAGDDVAEVPQAIEPDASDETRAAG